MPGLAILRDDLPLMNTFHPYAALHHASPFMSHFSLLCRSDIVAAISYLKCSMHDTSSPGVSSVGSCLHPSEQVAIKVRACLFECTMHSSLTQCDDPLPDDRQGASRCP